MIVLPFLSAADLPSATAAVREALRAHEVVALPTETFYGLAVDPADAAAVARIFALKSRPPAKDLLVVGANLEQLDALVDPGPWRGFLAATWPAPLTVVLPARVAVPAAGATLAVRVPDHPLLRSLLARIGPLTATSANRSDAASPASAAQVRASLGDGFALLLDGGRTPGGAPSTLIDLTGERPRVLRQGAWSGEVTAL